jgi:hypothetical protein
MQSERDRKGLIAPSLQCRKNNPVFGQDFLFVSRLNGIATAQPPIARLKNNES